MTDKEIIDELIKSRDKLIAEHIVDTLFIPFCYPHGNYNENIAGMVNETGYSLAATTKNGWNNAESDFKEGDVWVRDCRDILNLDRM